MSRISSYSSVSVVDLTDIGQINSHLSCNMPNSVIFDPNQNSYQPSWADTNLVITPVIAYNGTSLSLSASGLTITYTRKDGTSAATSLTSGETVSGGILTVSANKLATSTSGQLTYICDISYTDPEVGATINTQNTLTFSLISMATELKSVNITGDSAFMYDSNRVISGLPTITLTANLTNCSIAQWQYQNSQGGWVAFPTTYNASITGVNLTVNHQEPSIWLNGRKAIIRVLTDDPAVFDIHQVMKLYDGVAGNATVVAALSNENHYVPCDSSGNPTTWNGASTTISIFEGSENKTSTWTITTNLGNGLQGTYDSETFTFTPSSMTQDSSYVDFVCTKTDYSTITKRYTLTKQLSGADGKDAVVYMVETANGVQVINMDESSNYSPATITFKGFSITGNGAKTPYSGRFIISETTNGSTYTTKYTSSSNESSHSYTPTAYTSSYHLVGIRCQLFKAGGTTEEVDTQSIFIVRDGVSGQDGDDGLNGVSMGLGNYQDTIACTNSGAAKSASSITIPFFAFSGITRIPVTAVLGTLPTGVSITSNTAGTVNAEGSIVLAVANGATFSNTLNQGQINITLTATYNGQNQSTTHKYTWSKAIQGESPVFVQLSSPNGGTVNLNKTATIEARVFDGTTDVTNQCSFVWKRFVSGAYTTISGQTASSIIIDNTMVDDEMYLQCIATYGGSPYESYYTVDDTTDIDAVTYATITEFKNGQGCAAVYTRCYMNGVEQDPIVSTTFSETAPSAPHTGDYYYKLDSTNKTVTLMKYSGSAWAVVETDVDDFTYKYYRLDNKGELLDTSTPWKIGRVQYIDPSIVNGRMQFLCEVSN